MRWGKDKKNRDSLPYTFYESLKKATDFTDLHGSNRLKSVANSRNFLKVYGSEI